MTVSKLRIWRSRAVIIAIGLTALIPFLLAFYYARHPELVEKTSNYGALIIPARELGYDQLLARPVSGLADLEKIKGRWVLLQVAEASCTPICADALHKTQQGWLMLSKEMPRVKRLLLAGSQTRPADVPLFRQDDDALLMAELTPGVRQALMDAVGQTLGEGMIILLDPYGNLVLWYDTGFDTYRMVKDLKHLLKASQIG